MRSALIVDSFVGEFTVGIVANGRQGEYSQKVTGKFWNEICLNNIYEKREKIYFGG